MKNLKYKILGILFGILALNYSCTDLDETAYDKLIAEKLLENPSDKDLAAVFGRVYAGLKPLYWSWTGGYWLNEECADIVVTPGREHGWVDDGRWLNQHMHTWSTDHAHSNSAWANSYTGISAANEAIYQINTGGIPLSGDAKNSALAEMKVLRAFYYYYLCDVFGNVPIDTIFPPAEGVLLKQSTRKEVYDYVEDQVLSSIDYLSKKTGPAVYGKFSKWAAHTLLAKLYLNAEVYTGTPQWEKCIEQCDSVIAHGGYILEPEYSDNFIVHNEYSGEIILPITFSSDYDEDNGWFFLYLKTLHFTQQAVYQTVDEPWNGCAGIPQFIDTYDPKDTRLDKTWLHGQQYAANGDSLFCSRNENVGIPLNFTNTLAGAVLSHEWEGYRIGKFEIEVNGLRHAENDFPIWRYADVLMMKAECLLRTGHADEAATLVTDVRKRSFEDEADATVTGSELLQGSTYKYGLVTDGVLESNPEGGADIQYGRFLDELGWEFACEGRRRQDLIRFGVFTTKKWLSHVPNGDYRSLYPIPFSQMQANSNLVQNPGYNE